MYSRSRDRGSIAPSDANIGSIKDICVQARRVFNGQWVLETREVEVPRSLVLDLNDQESITDVIGARSRFNTVGHTRSIPIGFAAGTEYLQSTYPLASWPTSWQNQAYKFTNGDIKFSIDEFLVGDLPTVDEPIDWNGLVQGVADVAEGRMGARSNILVSMAELRQTMRMIRNPFGLLTARWRRSNKPLRQLAKVGANVWLEKKYGWDNFFRDMKHYASAIKKSRAHVLYLKSTLGSWISTSRSQVDKATVPVNRSIGSLPLTLTVKDITVERTARFGLRFYRGPEFSVLSSREYALQGMGADKLVEALWDVLPFSFVVDWFIDIGKVAAMRPILWRSDRLDHVGYSVLHKYTASSSILRGCNLYGDGLLYYGFDVPATVVRKTYYRYKGFPPSTEAVGYFGNLRMQNMIDAAALITQRI